MQKFLLACEADARGRTGLEDREYPQNKYLTSVLGELSQLDVGELLKEAKPKNTQEFVQKSRLNLVTDIIARMKGSPA